MSYPIVPPTVQVPARDEGPTSGLAVAGFVLAFVFAPLGLVLSLVAISRTGPGRGGGRGLAVSGAVISGLLVLVGLAVLGAAGAAQEAAQQEGVVPEAAPEARPDPVPPVDEPGTGQGAVAPDQPVAPGIGAAVTDGEFTFTVDSVERIGSTVGNEWVSETASGEFVLIRVTVTNTGDEPRAFNAGDQDLYDVDGRLFEGQPGLFLLENAEDSFFRTINPGLTVSGAPLLYDVPVAVELDRIELHDAWYSAGAAVSLR